MAGEQGGGGLQFQPKEKTVWKPQLHSLTVKSVD